MQRLRPVFQPGDAFMLGALSAAEKSPIVLHAVADDLATAVGTNRRQRMNCTFERIEGVFPAIHRDRERFVVVVSAYFHKVPLPYPPRVYGALLWFTPSLARAGGARVG